MNTKFETNRADIIKSIEDRDAPNANPRRGYHASEFVVTFQGGTPNEQLAVMEKIQAEKAKHNMWAYKPQNIGVNVWMVSYGFDSGD